MLLTRGYFSALGPRGYWPRAAALVVQVPAGLCATVSPAGAPADVGRADLAATWTERAVLADLRQLDLSAGVATSELTAAVTREVDRPSIGVLPWMEPIRTADAGQVEAASLVVLLREPDVELEVFTVTAEVIAEE